MVKSSTSISVSAACPSFGITSDSSDRPASKLEAGHLHRLRQPRAMALFIEKVLLPLVVALIVAIFGGNVPGISDWTQRILLALALFFATWFITYSWSKWFPKSAPAQLPADGQVQAQGADPSGPLAPRAELPAPMNPLTTNAGAGSGSTYAADRQTIINQAPGSTLSLPNNSDAMADTLKQNQTVLEATVAANELAQRAWVSAKFGKFVIIPGQHAQYDAKIVNLGKTPALKCWYSLSFIGNSAGVPDSEFIKQFEREIDESKEPKSTIFPQSELFMNHVFFTATEETVRALNDGRIRICVIGKIHYEDVFGKRHTTKFFYQYRPAISGLVGLPDYNEAD